MFSIITPVFSVTWSSEIILICWFSTLSTLKTVVLLHIFLKKVIFFRIPWSIENKKNSIINDFTVNFDQLNASLLNKCVLLAPNFWTLVYKIFKTEDRCWTWSYFAYFWIVILLALILSSKLYGLKHWQIYIYIYIKKGLQ